MSKYISLIFLILMVQSCAQLSITKIDKITQTGGAQLKDISVFHEFSAYMRQGADAPVFCGVWGSFELENGTLPLENAISNGSKNVYRVNASGSGGIMFPFHGWASFSLEQYYPNGVIEFDILGASGGEDFSIGIRSSTRGRTTTRSVSLSSQNIRVTKSWQHIRIPVKNIIGSSGGGFSIENVTMIILDVPRAQKIYLSEMYITSQDNEKQYPVIKVNQTGYRPDHAKFALVSCFPDTLRLSQNTEFAVISKQGSKVFSGKLTVLDDKVDDTTGEMVFLADFSSLNEPGEYCISIAEAGVDNSYFFTINSGVYDKLFVDAMRYYYYQRQGIDLDARYAGAFARKNMHPGDSYVKKLSQDGDVNAPVYDLSRGWYDAGDFGKYFSPAASTVSDLLFAYEMFPDLFSDGQLNIPESGNGAPDFLDEIKWELDMMLKMEDGTKGGFYEVANYMNTGGKETIFIIDTDGESRSGDTKSTAATASAAAIFAHAYIVYKNISQYAAFAQKCLDTAKRAWEYLEANPVNTWVNGAGRGYYHSQSEVDMMKFWAAAALYRADGAMKYQDYILETYQGFNYDREFNSYQVTTTGYLGLGFIHYAMSKNTKDAVIDFFENKFSNFQTGQLNNYNAKNWPTSLYNWAYYWGSNFPICHTPVELYLFNKVLNKDLTYPVQLVRDAVHYILGINPLSFSFVSGYGENCVKNIFSGIYTHDGIDEIPNGYMAGGANQYESGFMSNYASKCYVDSDGEWTTNEHAIYWNAALVFALAVERGTVGVKGDSKFVE